MVNFEKRKHDFYSTYLLRRMKPIIMAILVKVDVCFLKMLVSDPIRGIKSYWVRQQWIQPKIDGGIYTMWLSLMEVGISISLPLPYVFHWYWHLTSRLNDIQWQRQILRFTMLSTLSAKIIVAMMTMEYSL